MKTKIKPYLLRLLKENSLYIITLILLSFLLIFFVSVNLPKLEKNQQEIKTLSQEVNELKTKVSLINSLATNPAQLEEEIKFINALIPGEEDYFSIIYALEQLSLKTGFVITSYTVNIKNSNTNKLQLSITGVGDKEAFMKFLKQYNFGGGRLITSDEIELSPQFSGGIKINLTFYNKNIAKEKIPLTNQNAKFLSEKKEKKNKIQFSFKESSPEGELDYNYPRKTNPF